MAFKYKSTVLGGTFDHLHTGHKKLLKYGLSVSEKLVVGVTSDDYVKNLKTQLVNLRLVESFNIRRDNLEGFLNLIAEGRYEIQKIENIFGPTLEKDFNADVVIVSSQTKGGADKINEEREKKGLNKLDVLETEQVMAEDGDPISSEKIRNGEIDREGKLYIKLDWLKKDLCITEELRDELRKPWGQLLKDPSAENENFVICVGDETTRIINKLKIKCKIFVVDFKIARKQAVSRFSELGFSGNEKVYNVNNPAGSVTSELFKTVIEAVKNNTTEKQIIKIEGEDDLAVLPLILVSPLESLIFYGQPNEGLVKIRISEDIKAKAYKIMARFQTLGY